MYEVGKYLHDHPGGGEILKELAGQDATSGFEDAGHSDDAREIMDKFVLGSLTKEVSHSISCIRLNIGSQHTLAG